MCHEQWEFFARPFWSVLANGYLLLVGASLSRIDNKYKITELEFSNLVSELAPSMTFDTIHVVSRKRQRAL